MDATVDSPIAPAENQVSLGLLSASLLATVALADICFWRDQPRLSVGVFAIGATCILLLNRRGCRWNRAVCWIAALICGAAVESAIDLCFSNVLVLIALVVALAGETYYGSLRSGWSRWSEEIWTFIKTPGRWLALLGQGAKVAGETRPIRPGAIWKVVRWLWILIPGLFATMLFGVILGNGNALFAQFTDHWIASIREWVLSLDLNFWRCSFWALVAWLALPLLWPSPAPKGERIWTKELPLIPIITRPGTARLQSAVTLGLLNVLFCCVNTIDAIYLWARQALPAGVSFSAFVHEGVSSLITAVIFSAVLLAGIFQQPHSISRWKPLRILGLLWIGQNLVLLAGVFLRVKLYVDAFDLTVTRVNLVFFLLLVAAGFIFLAGHIWRAGTLGRLLHANLLAAFFLFYAVQFVDTAAFVARYNVNLWLKDHGARSLDIDYLKSLGPPAFEAVETVARSGSAPEAAVATGYLNERKPEADAKLGSTSWASLQFREMECEKQLLRATY